MYFFLTYSETGNSDLTFEPGWLHRYPATSALHNGRNTPVETTGTTEPRTQIPSVGLPRSVMPDIRPLNSNAGQPASLHNPEHAKDSSGDGRSAYF
ncbi:unnamed protein product [Echinostoma caproni]|uniref:Uncharacterized protein n=1 Tax=Echinostoma caproni TaxID=27848 RepID=A0A183AE37_9TREM|nr:unnamed protein product [Echinostoma caproni]